MIFAVTQITRFSISNKCRLVQKEIFKIRDFGQSFIFQWRRTTKCNGGKLNGRFSLHLCVDDGGVAEVVFDLFVTCVD